MRITGWTWYDNPEYKDMFPVGSQNRSMDDIEVVKQLVAEELRNYGYKFTGTYHQGGDCGVPIIDNTWLFQCSCRMWGDIMAMAYPEVIDNSDGYGYTLWAWTPPEVMHVPHF